MKIYTKTGDKGQTSLASGQKVTKADPRVELYGSCDELNSMIGAAVSFLAESSDLSAALNQIQNTLFELGSELAGYRPPGQDSILNSDDVQFLEQEMDTLSEKLPKMKCFILPGGNQSSAFLHCARTICRRLERIMVKEQETNYQQTSLIYINRLSDFLFIAARYANWEAAIDDIQWQSRTKV